MSVNHCYRFESPLLEGVIIKRRNRFVMEVEIGGEIVPCHCPCTGRIGNLVFQDIPCLLSKAKDEKRKTPYTVEAISVNHKESYIGINQNAANRHVEHFLSNGELSAMIPLGSTVKREQVLGDSRLDFKVADTYIEVKTPLLDLQCEIAEDIIQKKGGEFSSYDRFIKHIHELAHSLQQNERAILLSCFLYDNQRFEPPKNSKNGAFIQCNIKEVIGEGVELWQINLKVDPFGVELLSCFPLEHMFEVA